MRRRWIAGLALLLLPGWLAPSLAAGQAVADSPLSRTDEVPPDDVRTVLGWSGGAGGHGGSWCALRADGRMEMPNPSAADPPEVPCALGVNHLFRLSVDGELWGMGWSMDAPVEFDVRRPDGSILARTRDEFGELTWTIDLGAPLGSYTATARQGARSLTGTFSAVRRIVGPVARVRPRLPAPCQESQQGIPSCGLPLAVAGESIAVALGGFEPRQDVRLLLYRQHASGSDVFRATVGSARADDRGEATYTLPTAADDPPGRYRIATVPTSRGMGASDGEGPIFCLSGTRAVAPGEPWEERLCPYEESPERLAQTVLLQTARTWASVVARDGAPIADLECVYAGRALADVQADATALRAVGQYVAARPAAPVVQSARRLDRGSVRVPTSDGETRAAGLEAVVSETWAGGLHHADGTLAAALPRTLERRYVIAQQHPERAFRERDAGNPVPPACEAGWLVVEATLLRSE